LSQGKYLDSATIEKGLVFPFSTAWHEYTTEKHDNLYPIQKKWLLLQNLGMNRKKKKNQYEFALPKSDYHHLRITFFLESQ